MTALLFNDASGNETGGLGIGEDGRRIFCFDYQGKERTCMYFLPNGRSGLLVQDEQQKERVSFGLNNAGQSELLLNDGAGKTRVRLQVDRSGKSALEMLDEKGLPLFSIPSRKK